MSRKQYRSYSRSTANNSFAWRWKVQLFLSLLFFALIAAWLYFPINPLLVERYYSQGIYPYLSSFFTLLQSFVPIPLTLLSLLLFLIVAIYTFFRAIRRARFWHWFVSFTFCLSVICLWFFVAWGANYQRLTVSELFDLDSVQVNHQDVEVLASYLLDVIEEDADSLRLHNSERNFDRNSKMMARAIQATSESMEALFESQGIKLGELPQNVKYWPKGTLLRGFSASGVMLPWFVEPTVDAGLADSDFTAVAAHELAHAAGIATEGDADFIGTLAALSADNPFSRYSAALRSYQVISKELSPDLKTEFDGRLPAIAKSDWNDTYNAYLQYQSPRWLKLQSQSVYNSYLQSQGIEDGIQDYSRSTQLLLQAMRKGLLP